MYQNASAWGRRNSYKEVEKLDFLTKSNSRKIDKREKKWMNEGRGGGGGNELDKTRKAVIK